MAQGFEGKDGFPAKVDPRTPVVAGNQPLIDQVPPEEVLRHTIQGHGLGFGYLVGAWHGGKYANGFYNGLSPY
jgi:hypothetical protein